MINRKCLSSNKMGHALEPIILVIFRADENFENISYNNIKQYFYIPPLTLQ